jgi:predicted DNA-binding transcriptional regulator AlpA
MKEKLDYPMILKAEHIAEILGCSKRRAYELMDLNSFPLIRLGRLKRADRELFFKWLQSQQSREVI